MKTADEIPPLHAVALPEPPVPGQSVSDVLAEIRQLRDAAVVLDHVCNRILAEFFDSEGGGPPDVLVQFDGEVPHLVDREAVGELLKELRKRPERNRRRARDLLRAFVAVGPSGTVADQTNRVGEPPLLPVTAQGRYPAMQRDQVVRNSWGVKWPRERSEGAKTR